MASASLPAACARFGRASLACRNPQLHGGGQGDAGINATPKGQLGQATAYGSAGQECPHPTPSGAAQIPTGWSWTPGCSLWHTQRETPHLQHNTCAGFSPQQEELRALCFSLPPPCEVLSLSHSTREEAGVQRG